jgi:hypothetical protein
VSGRAAPNRLCPRCGGAFRCGIDDTLPCGCASIELSAATLAALRSRHVGCLCFGCLRAVARGEAVAIEADAAGQPRRTIPSSAASGSTERGR